MRSLFQHSKAGLSHELLWRLRSRLSHLFHKDYRTWHMAHLFQWLIRSTAASIMGKVIPTKGQSTTDLSPRHSLQTRSEEHTSELQSLRHILCRLLFEKKN